MLLGGNMGAYHARQRAFIGQCQSAIIQMFGLGDQFLGLRSAAQKGKITQGVEFDVHDLSRKSAAVRRTSRANTNAWIDAPEIPTALRHEREVRHEGVRRAFGAQYSNRAPRPCRPTSRSRCAQGPVLKSNERSPTAAVQRAATRDAACLDRSGSASSRHFGCGQRSSWTRRQAASGRCSGIETTPYTASSPKRARKRSTNCGKLSRPARAGACRSRKDIERAGRKRLQCPGDQFHASDRRLQLEPG